MTNLNSVFHKRKLDPDFYSPNEKHIKIDDSELIWNGVSICEDIVFQVLSFLKPSDILNVELCQKKYRRLTSNNWKELAKKDTYQFEWIDTKNFGIEKIKYDYILSVYFKNFIELFLNPDKKFIPSLFLPGCVTQRVRTQMQGLWKKCPRFKVYFFKANDKILNLESVESKSGDLMFELFLRVRDYCKKGQEVDELTKYLTMNKCFHQALEKKLTYGAMLFVYTGKPHLGYYGSLKAGYKGDLKPAELLLKQNDIQMDAIKFLYSKMERTA